MLFGRFCGAVGCQGGLVFGCVFVVVCSDSFGVSVIVPI